MASGQLEGKLELSHASNSAFVVSDVARCSRPSVVSDVASLAAFVPFNALVGTGTPTGACERSKSALNDSERAVCDAPPAAS